MSCLLDPTCMGCYFVRELSKGQPAHGRLARCAARQAHRPPPWSGINVQNCQVGLSLTAVSIDTLPQHGSGAGVHAA